MTFLQQMFSEELLYALGWTVIHSLWQAVVVAVVMALVLLGLQKRSAHLRYIFANFSLGLVLGWAVYTFWDMYELAKITAANEIHFSGSLFATAEIGFLDGFFHHFTNYFNEHLPLIVLIWLLGFAFFMLRMVGGLIYIQHLKNRHNQILPAFWQEKLHKLAAQIPVRKSIGLVESALVKVPMVIGYFKPIILMPMGAINGLTVEQVEAILSHELAHISRHDYLLNILQSFIETLFYFNPAVWWISANIRSERENCCDDIAVELCGNSLAYAKALVSLQEVHAAAPMFAMPLSNNKNQLLNRVKRILNQPQNKSNIMEKFTTTLLLLVAMFLFSFGNNTPLTNFWEEEKTDFDVSIHVDLDHITNEEGSKIVATISRDTVPDKVIEKKKNKKKFKTAQAQNMEILFENGEVRELIINGETVPAEDYAKYQKEIEELKEISDTPFVPPSPPVAPTPPSELRFGTPTPPVAPSPPTAPNPFFAPKPPTAPSPPAARRFKKATKSRTITTEVDDDGNTIIIIEEEKSDDPVEIKIEKGENGAIYIDDQEVKGLAEGDQVIIIEEIDDDSYDVILRGGASSPSLWHGKTLKKSDKNKNKLHLKRSDKGQSYFRLKGSEDSSSDEGILVVPGNISGLSLFPDSEDGEDNNPWTDIATTKDFFALAPFALKNEKEDPEWTAFHHRWSEEYKERLKDGNISEEWMEKWKTECEEKWPDKKNYMWRYNYNFPNPSIYLNYDIKTDINEDLLKSYFGAVESVEGADPEVYGKVYSQIQGNLAEEYDIFARPNSYQSIGGTYRGNGFNFDDGLMESFRESMIQDGLLQKGQSFDIDLSSSRLKINGQKQPDYILEKYLNLYQKETGRIFGKGAKLKYKS